MGTLFGTDGIRGRANTYPMNCELVLKAGKAIALYYKKKSGANKKVIIGKDTRISGDMIESALITGLTSMGIDVEKAGVVPTPAISYLARKHDYLMGVMISASHNPYYDNGIKIFDNNGFKLNDATENEIEKILFDIDLEKEAEKINDVGCISNYEDSQSDYITFMKESFNHDPFSKKKLVLDCSNGATYKSAPEIFTAIGMDVTVISDKPDGYNINDNCGSQHTENLAKQVIELNADAGFAFDGDGDRLIAVNEKGTEITGDQLIAICSDYAHKNESLKSNTVVTTVMSNIGLKAVLKEKGINHIIADVGDRYVAEEMRSSGSVLGGEDSGHMIFMDKHTTGDGIYSALKILEIMCKSSESLSKLSGIMKVFPQKLINIDVNSKPDIYTIPEIKSCIEDVETRLKGLGRVLVRYSGTQLLCRVMVEGPTAEETETCCQEIAELIRLKIGV